MKINKDKCNYKDEYDSEYKQKEKTFHFLHIDIGKQIQA